MRITLSMVTALFLSCLMQQAAWATPKIQTSVSNNSVFLGDVFTLNIEINDSDSNFQLDTTPLEKAFHVSRPSTSSRSSYINGKTSQKTQWQISLQAKHTGTLIIPELKIGDLTSNAITISVKKPSTKATPSDDNLIFMENSLSKKSVYLGQPLIFTSKIYIAKNSDGLELLNPTLQGATVSVYGKDKNEETIRNGIRFNIITRQFEISVKKAGSFTIGSPLLTGNSRKIINIDDFQNRVISEPINIRGDSINIEIKNKPENFQGDWLISDDVRLLENTPLTKQRYHVGDPITRSVTLQIASIDQDKLPSIEFNYPKNLRFYPDQDQLKEGQANGLHYAQRTMSHAIIADQAGKLTLPEIKLPWWNSKTDKQEFAVLPAQTLTILAAQKQSKDIIASLPSAAPTATQDQKTSVVVDDKTLIYWQIASVFLLFALIMLIFFHLAYRRSQQSPNKQQNVVAKLTEHDLSLQSALKTQQPSAVYQALLNYAQAEFPTLKSLSELSKQMNLNEQDQKQLAVAIKILEKACATTDSTWNATPLTQLLDKYKQQKNSPRNEDIMNLNPSD